MARLRSPFTNTGSVIYPRNGEELGDGSNQIADLFLSTLRNSALGASVSGTSLTTLADGDSTEYIRNDAADVSDTGEASKVVRMRGDGSYPAADGSLLTNLVVSGTWNVDAAKFNSGALGASYSTGSIGFTPAAAILIGMYTGTGTKNLSIGYFNGSGTTNQIAGSLRTTGVIRSVENRVALTPNGSNSEWNCTAFGSGDITITRQVGSGSLTASTLLVFA